MGMAIGLVGVWIAHAALARYLSRQPEGDSYAANEVLLSRMRVLASGRAIVVMLSIVLALGTAVLNMVEHDLFRQPWCSIASTLVGFASGGLFLVWAAFFAQMGRKGYSSALGLAFVVGGVLYVLCALLPEPGGTVVAVAAPLASLACFMFCVRYLNNRGVELLFASVPRPELFGTRRVRRGYLARALVAMGLVGFAESFERALFVDVGAAVVDPSQCWVLWTAVVVAAVVLGLSAVTYAREGSSAGMGRVIMVVMTLLMLSAPTLSGLGPWTNLANLTCYFLLYMLVWSVFIRMAAEHRLSVMSTFAPSMGIASVGCLLGTLFGSLLMSEVSVGLRGLELLSLACGGLTMVSFAFLLNDDVVSGLTNSNLDRPSAPRRFELRCREVAERYALSAREPEVMTLAAKGRTTQRIQEALGISTGTVNTHLAHVYKKLGVHDRQEMLDLIDGTPDK